MLDYNQANHWFMLISSDAFVGAKPLGAKGGDMSRHFQKDTKAMSAEELLSPVISVKSAYYGANAWGKIPATTVTKKMRSLVNGKTSVAYKVSYLDHGDPAVNVKKDFSITWECYIAGDPGRKFGNLRSIVLDENAENQVIDINCRRP